MARAVRLLRLLGQPTAPLVVIGIVLAAWLVGQLDNQPYVLYRGERWPTQIAADRWCHDLALPQVRCFDSMDEMERDISENFPYKIDALRNLMNMTPEP